MPKYDELAQALRVQIQSGVLRPGDKLPTLTAMRSTQNISRPTVEKAYSILASEGWIERSHGMSAIVAAPRRKATAGVLGLCGFEVTASSSYWKELVAGINYGANSVGAQVLLLPYHVGVGWEKVDGVILCDWLNEYYHHAIPAQLPVVSLFVEQKKWRRSSVTADEYSGVVQAMRHLQELGHQRIAYLFGRDKAIAGLRLQAYEDALQAAGTEPSKNWIRMQQGKNDYAAEFRESGYRDVLAWIDEKGVAGWNQIGCTALLCHNDETAIGAMQAFAERSVRVPQDVSVIGFDGTDVGEYSSPRLTSIGMPLRRMGEAAVALLQNQIHNDESIMENRTFPTQLVERQSTARVVC